MQPSDSSRLPQQLRLLDFLSRPGIALATAGGVRSPRFRRDPFIRDVASDPGRATVPCIAAPHMLPSAVATASAPATSRISWLNPTPQMITVYASPWSSPSPTQHSLPSGRYPLPGPDFHRLDPASFAWRTANPSPPSGWVEDFHLRAIEHAGTQLRPLVSGIEQANSIAFDFHKWLHVPYDAGCILVRDGSAPLGILNAPGLSRQPSTRAGGRRILAM